MYAKQVRDYFNTLIETPQNPYEKGEGGRQLESLILWHQNGVNYQVIITHDNTLLFVRNDKVVLTCPCEEIWTISAMPSGTLVVRIGKTIKLVHGTLS